MRPDIVPIDTRNLDPMDLHTVTVSDAEGGEPHHVAVITVDPADTGHGYRDNGYCDNGYLAIGPLTTLMASIPDAARSVVLTTGPTSETLLSLAVEGLMAVTVVQGTDAVKLVADGMVVSTLDRNHVVVARLPVTVPTALLVTALGDATAGGVDRIHLTDLTSRIDPGRLRLLPPDTSDSGGPPADIHHTE